VADPATLPWTLVLILLALPVGMGSLMTVGGMLHGWSRGRSRSVDEEFVRLGLVTLPPLVAWVLVRRWFVRLEPRWRRVVLVIFALIAVTGCRMGMVAA